MCVRGIVRAVPAVPRSDEKGKRTAVPRSDEKGKAVAVGVAEGFRSVLVGPSA